MKKTSKTRKTAAAPSASAPTLVYTPPRIRAHLDRACAKPAPEPPPPSAPEAEHELGVYPAPTGGFNVYLGGKFRGWKKTETEAEAYLARLLRKNGNPPPPAPEPREVQVAPEEPAKEPEKAPVPPAPEAPESPVAFLLENFSDEAIRAEAVRRGLIKPAKAPKANGDRRPPANREEHAALTKKAWEKARELAAAKGGKPTDHMKEAWAGLVRD